jgi:hypothetical protein
MMNNINSLSIPIVGFILLFAVFVGRLEISYAQTGEDIFGSSNRSCSEDTSTYDRIYRTKPIALTAEELTTYVYPSGKEARGYQRHEFCIDRSSSDCEGLYWCWPNWEKIRKVTKPTPKKADDPKKEVSDACRKNPDSYTCLYGHEEIMVPKTDPREPFELVIDESVEVQCFEEEWKKWRDDWDQKVLKVLNQALFRFTLGDKNSYQINFPLRIGPDGRVISWAQPGADGRAVTPVRKLFQR